MKKQIQNSILLTGFIVFFLISCENIKDQNERLKENQCGIENLNGILNFTSVEELFETLVSLNSMTESERMKWESSMDFVSQRTLYNNLISELDGAKTDSELRDILNRHKDLITINSNFEINPALEYGQYPLITNRRGYFSINGILHKVTQEKTYIAKVQGIDDLDQILIEEGIYSDKIIVLENKSNVNAKNCGDYLEGQVTEGNRRAKIYMTTFKTVVNNGYEWVYRDYVQWYVKGFKKVLGIWYSYNTSLSYRDVSFTVVTMFQIWGKAAKSGGLPDYAPQHYEYPGLAESPSDCKVYGLTVPVGEIYAFTEPKTLQSPYFNQVAGEGKSRGTTGWAAIDCGYYY